MVADVKRKCSSAKAEELLRVHLPAEGVRPGEERWCGRPTTILFTVREAPPRFGRMSAQDAWSTWGSCRARHRERVFCVYTCRRLRSRGPTPALRWMEGRWKDRYVLAVYVLGPDAGIKLKCVS